MSFSVNEVTCLLGGRNVLDKASFRLGDGEKCAIVGENGSGKSTLLKCIAGLLTPDSGEVSYSKGTTIGYLPQESALDSSRTLREELLSVFDEVLSAEAEMRELEHLMGETPHDSKEFEKISHRYDDLHHLVLHRGGYSLESDVGRVSAGLGFTASDLDRPCRQFSGGWQMRILLAKLLLQQPDILLLDEPTNHLDLESILWLEDWVRNSPCDVLMVSHERAFMDNLVERIFELHLGMLWTYRGNYTNYLEEREERYENMRRAYENQQIQKNQIQRFIDKNRADKSRAAQVQSRIKILEKMDDLPLPPSYKTIRFAFPQPERGSKEVVSLVDCDKWYGPRPVLRPFNLNIYRGDRIALVGLNGAGKSTLIKMLAGTEPPSHGKRVVGANTVLEFCSQYQYEDLNPASDVLSSALERAPLDQSANVRDLLGAFLFSGDDVFKKVPILSGGEKTRLRLARMLFSGANILLLDEPTNHLDVASRATLERALSQYEGTIVFVSHDRVFMDRIATKVLEIHNGLIRHYPGNFTDYIRAKQREIADGLIESAPFMISDGRIHFTSSLAASHDERLADAASSKKKSKEEKRREADARNEFNKKKRPLEEEIKKLEQTIHKAEMRISEIDQLLAQPDVYTNASRCAELVSEKKSLQTALEKSLPIWEKKNQDLDRIKSEFNLQI